MTKLDLSHWKIHADKTFSFVACRERPEDVYRRLDMRLLQPVLLAMSTGSIIVDVQDHVVHPV
jgi:hypothetical protein